MLMPTRKTAEAARQRQLHTKRQTPLLSSLSLLGRNSPPPGFLPFFSALPFPWQHRGRLTLGCRRWPWSPFHEWGDDGRGGNPHFLSHLSTINFPLWLLWRTKQEQSRTVVSVWQRARKQQEDGLADCCLQACRCSLFFHFVCLLSIYILFTLEECLLLRASLDCWLRKTGVGSTEAGGCSKVRMLPWRGVFLANCFTRIPLF